MDVATLAAGMDTALDTFGTSYGPIVLLIVGFAVGIYGVKFAWGFLTNYVRARRAKGE